jgi:hypothetical protein
MELEAIGWQSDPRAPSEEAIPVGGDEVRERMAVPSVTMEPESSAHRVHHPGAAFGELLPLREERGGILRRWERGEGRRRAAH